MYIFSISSSTKPLLVIVVLIETGIRLIKEVWNGLLGPRNIEETVGETLNASFLSPVIWLASFSIHSKAVILRKLYLQGISLDSIFCLSTYSFLSASAIVFSTH